MISRRSFLRALGACTGIGAGAGFYTFQIEPNWLEIVRRPLPLRRLPAELAGRTVAHLSDIHVSHKGLIRHQETSLRRGFGGSNSVPDLSALLILKHYCVEGPSSEIRILASSMQGNFVRGLFTAI